MTIAPRVAYRERQRLFAADLTAEQEYRLGVAGRHLLAAHDWGLVSAVDPAFAIDGYGRELLLWSVPDPVSGKPILWIYYCEQAPQSARCCDSIPLSRIEQRAVAAFSDKDDLVPAETPAQRISRTLSGRAAGAIPGAALWPVLADPENQRVHYTTLSAAAVSAVAGTVKLQIGRTSTTDPFQFAIWQDSSRCRLAADRDNVWFRGDVLVAATRKAALLTISEGQFAQVEEKTPGMASALERALRGARTKLDAKDPKAIFPPSIWKAFEKDFTVTTVTIPGLREVASDFADITSAVAVNRTVRLVPSSLNPSITAMRQVVAIKPADPKAPVPVQIQCGQLQDSDFSTRFAVVGDSTKTGVINGLSVTGEGSLRIGGSAAPKGDPPKMIFVNGTLELPPVKASILDPLFNPLLVLTFIAGLRRANSYGAAWLTGLLNVPDRIGVGEDFSYSLVITPNVVVPMQTTRLLERFRLEDGTSVQNIRSESPVVPGTGTQPVTVNLPVNGFTFGGPGDTINIEMELAIKVGDVQTSVLVPASNPIRIEDPPVLALDLGRGIDDFVPLGSDWTYTVQTEDRPSKFTLQQLSITTNGAITFPKTDVATLSGATSSSVKAVNASQVVEITATLDYHWLGNPAPSPSKHVTKKVQVGGIQIELGAPLKGGGKSDFQAKLSNSSGATIENIRNFTVDIADDNGTRIDGFVNGTPRADILDTESELFPATPRSVDLTNQSSGAKVNITVSYGLTRRQKTYKAQVHTFQATLL